MTRRPAVRWASLLALGLCTLGLGECEDGSRLDVKVAWTVPLAESSANWQGKPIIADGLALTQHGPALRAYDIVTGGVRWTTVLRSVAPLNAQNIAAVFGRAFVATGDSVFAVRLTDGARLWAYLPDQQAALCEIAADDSGVYVGTRSHRVYRLDPESGTLVWSVDIGTGWPFFGQVVGLSVSGDTVYVAAEQWLNASGGLRTAHVLALRRSTGEELWRFAGPDSANDAQRAPTVQGNVLLLSNNWHDGQGGSMFALDRFTGDELWRLRFYDLGPAWAPVTDGTLAFAGAWDGYVFAATLSGEQQWEATVGSSVSSFALCGSVLLANDFSLEILDPQTGRLRGRLFENSNDAHLTSGIAVSGSRAFVVGNKAAYGLECS